MFSFRSLRPVIVESYEEPDEFDGYPEKNVPRKHPEFVKAREVCSFSLRILSISYYPVIIILNLM